MKVGDGSVGSTFCTAGHDAILTSAQADYTSAGYVYGLSSSTEEIYVFRTSNLLATPEAIECTFEMKFKLQDTPMLERARATNQTLQMVMTSIKGGLLVTSQSDD